MVVLVLHLVKNVQKWYFLETDVKKVEKVICYHNAHNSKKWLNIYGNNFFLFFYSRVFWIFWFWTFLKCPKSTFSENSSNNVFFSYWKYLCDFNYFIQPIISKENSEYLLLFFNFWKCGDFFHKYWYFTW